MTKPKDPINELADGYLNITYYGAIALAFAWGLIILTCIASVAIYALANLWTSLVK